MAAKTVKAAALEVEDAPKEKKASKTARRPKDTDKAVSRYRKPPIQDIVKRVNMLHGDHGPIARLARDAWDVSDLRRPSGIVGLDLATGGGLVAGKVHQIEGPEGWCKNYLLYRFFAKVQEHYGDKACLAQACFEGSVDKHFAQLCGCKIAMSEYDVEVSQRRRKAKGLPPLTRAEIKQALECPDVGEFTVLEGPADRVLDGVVEFVKSNQFQMIGIDSWDAMLTAAEDNTPLGEDPQMASAATLQTRWMKKVIDAFNPVYICPRCGYDVLDKKITDSKVMNYRYKCSNCGWGGLDPDVEVNETTLYCIRQVRAKFATGRRVFGRPFESKGAHSLKHLNTIRITLSPGQYLKHKDKKIGKEVNWEISKAKCGAREGATGYFRFYFNPLDVDTEEELFETAKELNVLRRSGGSSRWEVEGMEGETWNGNAAILDALEKEPDLYNFVQAQCYLKSELSHVRFT